MSDQQYLFQIIQHAGSILEQRARDLLAARGLGAAAAQKVIDAGARDGSWQRRGAGLYAAEQGDRRPASLEASESTLLDAIHKRGALYRDGALASLTDQGMSPEEARNTIRKAVQSGSVRLAGSTLVAATEESSLSAVGEETALEEIFAGERLTAAVRRQIPDTMFAWPARKWGPLIDPRHPTSGSHARNAMARLNQAYNAGRISDVTYTKVRKNILRAYDRFGIKARAPSALAGPAPGLRRAAEPDETTEETTMTKAERKAIALKNLKKAWAKTGARPRGGKAGGGHKGGSGRKGGHARTTRGRAHEGGAWEVAERKPGGKGLSREERREIAMRNLQKAWASPALGSPVKPAGRPAAARAGAPAAIAPHKGAGKPAAPKAGRKGGRRKGTMPVDRYIGSKTGAIITIQRVYPRENPILSRTGEAVGAVSGLAVAAVASDWVDRMLATRAPSGTTDPRYGVDAAMAIRTKPDALRMGAQFAGAVVLGAAGYGLSHVSSTASHTAYGAALAFGLRFLWQVLSGHLLPAVFKAASPAEKTFSNRYYADMQDWAQQGAQPTAPPATPAAPPAPATTASGVAAGGLPAGVASMMPGYGRSTAYGPVAVPAGAVGCGGVSGCGGAGNGCPTCRATPGKCSCGRPVAAPPSMVQPPQTVTPAQPMPTQPSGVNLLPQGQPPTRFDVQPTAPAVPQVTQVDQPREPDLADLLRLSQAGSRIRGSSVLSLVGGSAISSPR